MEVLFLLLPITIGIVMATVFVFAWAVRDGQFDDLETPAVKLLLDDANKPAESPGREEKLRREEARQA